MYNLQQSHIFSILITLSPVMLMLSVASATVLAATRNDCMTYQSCNNMAMNASNHSNIICSGYDSCCLSSLFTTQLIVCDASVSCVDSSLSIGGDNSRTNCMGRISCSSFSSTINSVAIPFTEKGYYGCFGHYACIDTQNNWTLSSNWQCLGSNSCWNTHSVFAKVSTVTLKQVLGWGSFSLHNSTISTGGYGNTLLVYLKGYYAGYRFNISCNKYDVCIVLCYGNGCKNLRLDCDVGTIECVALCADGNDTDCIVSKNKGFDEMYYKLNDIIHSYDENYTLFSVNGSRYDFNFVYISLQHEKNITFFAR